MAPDADIRCVITATMGKERRVEDPLGKRLIDCPVRFSDGSMTLREKLDRTFDLAAPDMEVEIQVQVTLTVNTRQWRTWKAGEVVPAPKA